MSNTIKKVTLIDGKLVVEIIQHGQIVSGTGSLPKDFLVTETYVSDNNKIALESSTKKQL